MKNKKSYIKLNRSIEEWPQYFAEPFTRALAWIDLLLLANHKRGVLYIRGNKIVVERSFVCRSESTLASRWKWSRNKVRRFLKELETEQQIEQQKTASITLIRIINYEKYQANETTDGTTERQQTEQQKDNRRNTYKKKQEEIRRNKKNEESGGEKISPTPKETMLEFISAYESRNERFENLIEKLSERYNIPADHMSREVNRFVNYWCERTRDGKKQRWETERTFEVQRRLITWFSNAQKFRRGDEGGIVSV